MKNIVLSQNITINLIWISNIMINNGVAKVWKRGLVLYAPFLLHIHVLSSNICVQLYPLQNNM